MAWVQGVGAQGIVVSSVTTATITTTAGNCLVIGAGCSPDAGGDLSVSTPVQDSKANTWTATPSTPVSGTGGVNKQYMYTAPVGTRGASHTFTANLATSGYVDINVGEFSGRATSSVVDTDAALKETLTGGGSNFVGPTFIPLAGSDGFMAECDRASVNPSTATPSSGWTVSSAQVDGGSGTAGHAQYKANLSAGSQGVPWQLNSANVEALQIVVALKAAGSSTQHVEASNSPRPGRGPFSKNKFRVSDTTAYTASTSNVTVGLTGQSASFTAGQLLGYAPQFYETPNFPRPGRGPFSKGRFYVSDTTAFTSSSSGDVTVALTGQSATSTAGSLAPSASLALTGQAGTLATGTVVANLAHALTGQADTFAAGTLVSAQSVTLSGQGSTSAAGTVAPSAAVALTGRSATFTAGTVSSGSDVTASLTGQAVTTTAGSIFAASQIAVTGQSAATSAGTLSFSASLALVGQSGAFAAGTLVQSHAVGLAGQGATFTTGVVSPPGGITLSLTGQSSAFTTGALSPSAAIALGGQSAVSTAGTLIAAPSVALTGRSLSSSSGTVLGSFALGLSGQAGVFGTGLVLPPTDKSASLIGSLATFRTGSLIGIGAVLTGTPTYVVRRLNTRIFTVSAVTYRQFPPKDTSEAIKLEFDFSPDLATGVILAGTPTVTVTVSSGADAAPTGIFNGLPRFDITSTQVIVPVLGGITNVDYDIKVVVGTTDALTTLALSAILPIRE